MHRLKRRNGLTLIEIVVTLAIMAIVVAAYIVVANPAGQLSASRNNTRTLNVETIALAIRQNIADQGDEEFSCSSGSLPTSSTDMGSSAGEYNIAPCLVSTYLATMPVDPSASSAFYTSASNYDTDYTIAQNSSGSITVAAPNAELNKIISTTR